MMRIRAPRFPAILLAAPVVACADFLAAENFNNPDISRVFATPSAIEQTLGSSYQLCRNRALTSDVNAQMLVMALAMYSQLANAGMGVRGAIPRSPILNNRSVSQAQPETFSTWSRQARLTANALQSLDKHLEAGRTIGTNGQDFRARAMGFFAMGCNLGWLAMVYDSAGIVHHHMHAEEIPPLSGYVAVMNAALASFDSAIAIAQSPLASTSGGFPTPSSWFGGNALTADQFIRLARSYRARFRARVARSPDELAAVDWNAVVNDSENGLSTDLVVQVGGTTGWSLTAPFVALDAAIQMTPFIWGFADVSGGYDAWIASPMDDRRDFLLVTPDLRWPSGQTRDAQTASSRPTGTYRETPYIAHWPLAFPGDAWGVSQYFYSRYGYLRRAGFVGSQPDFLRTELDLLAAEGYLRTNRIAEAASRIDRSRVTFGGLPALAGSITTASQAVPGGPNCVPRVPQPPNFTTTACGTILEALKYEKRVELAFLPFGSWYFDARAWGDLIENTPLEYPVPALELDARNLPHYNLGGGGPSSARRGTYGFP